MIKFDDVMNDQRQVIFSKLKILKEKNIDEILKDFLKKLVNLNTVRENFQNRDEKLSTETKIITGNIINDDELLNWKT